jgi:hypothetical protein
MMAKVEEESTIAESALRPLVEAANTEYWKNALNVLYLNGGVLSFSDGYQIPVLISLNGKDEGVERFIDLLMGKAKTGFTQIIASFLRFILPQILTFAQNKKIQTPAGVSEERMLGILAGVEVTSKLQKHEKKISELIIQGASSISDMIVAGTFQALMKKRDMQIQTFLDDDEYEEMIDALEKLGLIESKLQVSLCPNCGNYQFVVSPNPWVMESCSKCGDAWATLTLYTFSKPLDTLKLRGSDFPLFISSYLRNKIISLAPFGEVEIYPLAKVRHDLGEAVEIDVYIPQHQLGIECKTFEDCYAPLTESRIGSIVGKLVPQVQRYVSMGVVKVVIVSNLPEDAIAKVHSATQKELTQQGIEAMIDFVGGEPEVLLKKLDQIAESMAEKVQDDFRKRASGQLPGADSGKALESKGPSAEERRVSPTNY